MKTTGSRHFLGGLALSSLAIGALAALYGSTWVSQNVGVTLRYGAFAFEVGELLNDPLGVLTEGVRLEIPATVSNRTFLPLALEDVWFDVYVNDELIAEGEGGLPSGGAQLPAGETLDLNLRTRIAAARAAMLPFVIARQRKLEVDVEGVATVRVFGFEVQRDFRVTGVDLLLQPRVEW